MGVVTGELSTQPFSLCPVPSSWSASVALTTGLVPRGTSRLHSLRALRDCVQLFLFEGSSGSSDETQLDNSLVTPTLCPATRHTSFPLPHNTP